MRGLLAALLFISGALFTIAAEQQPQSPSTAAVPGSELMRASSVESAPSEPAITLKATTRMVVLDVVATDKHGNAVTDLKSNDFTLLENGHEQKIGSFTFELGPATGRIARPTALESSPDVFSNIQFTTPPKTLNVILLDALNTNLQNHRHARLQMLRFLKTMPAGPPIAIYTLTRGLHLLQDFTSDTNLLLEVATNYRAKNSAVPDSPTDGPRDGIFPVGALTGNPLAAGLMQSVQNFITNENELDLDKRVRLTSEALQTLSRTLAGYPGRKNLIWLSESFPLNLFPDSGHEMYPYTFRGRAGDYYDPILRKTTNSLIDAQISIYPVDAAGLITVGLGAMDAGYDALGRAQFGPAHTAVVGRQLDALAANQSTMGKMAARTGGKAFHNRNDLPAAIQSSITHGSTYYLLGYYPSDKNWSGGFRKVEVKVNRSDINLRYHAGYYAIDKQYNRNDSRASNRELAEALDLSTPPSTMLLFTATLTPPSANTANKLVVSYRTNASSISFEQGTDGLRRAAVGCYLQAFSEDGRPVKAIRQLSETMLKPATYQRVVNEGFPCTTAIDLPAGKYQLRFAVRDERTGQFGTANGKVTIP